MEQAYDLEVQPEVSHVGGAVIRIGRRILDTRGAQVVREVLTWVLTVLMLQALGIGLLVTSSFFAAGGLGYSVGAIAWHITMVTVGLFGTLAFVSKGRFAASLGYLVGSAAANYGFWIALFGLSLFGLSLISPLLVIPLSLAWNGAYTYFAWRLLIAPTDDCPRTAPASPTARWRNASGPPILRTTGRNER